MLAAVLIAGPLPAAEEPEAIARDAVREHLRFFSQSADGGTVSRRAGSPGLAAAVDYVRRQLADAGYDPTQGTTGRFQFSSVHIQPGESGLTVTRPNGELLISGAPISALAPSGIKPTHVPRARPLVAPVVYGGRGTLEELSDRPIRDCIVLLEFNSGDRWTRAFQLGAKAVVFLNVEGGYAMGRSECELKVLTQPIDAPRFYLDGSAAETLRKAVAPLKGMDPATYPQMELYSESIWGFRDAESIWALIPGKPSEEGQDEPLVVLWANLEGSGTVLDRAPAAREALGAAILLELAKYYGSKSATAQRIQPRGNLLLIFNTDHCLGMNGERLFAEMNFNAVEMRKSLGAARHPQQTLKLIDDSGLVGLMNRLVQGDLALDCDEKNHLTIERDGKMTPLFSEPFPEGAASPDSIVFAQYSGIRDAVARWYRVQRMQKLTAVYFAYVLAVDAYGQEQGESAEMTRIIDELAQDPVFRSVGKTPQDRRDAVKNRLTAGFFEQDPLIRDMPLCAPEFMKKLLGIIEAELESSIASLNSRERLNPIDEPARELARSLKIQELQDVQILGTFLNRTRSVDARLAELLQQKKDGDAQAAAIIERATSLQKDRLLARVQSVLNDREEHLRQEIERFTHNWPLFKILAGGLPNGRRGQGLQFFLSLELSAGSGRVGLFPAGAFIGQPGAPGDVMKNVAKDLMPIMAQAEYGLTQKNADMKNAPEGPQGDYAVMTIGNQGREWQTFMSDATPLSSEVPMTTRIPALTLLSVFDSAPYVSGPADRLFPEEDHREDWLNIDRQLTYLNRLMPNLLERSALYRAQASFDDKWFRFTVVHGRALMRGAREVFANTPVSHALVELTNGQGQIIRGVSQNYVTYSNPFGEYRLQGMRIGQGMYIMGYKVDPKIGEIVMVRNLVKDKDLKMTAVKKPVVEQNLELARMRAMGLISVLDPRFLVKLSTLRVLDGETDSVPQDWSYTPSRADLARVVFGNPAKRLKVLYSQGKFGVRMAYLGGTDPVTADLDAELKNADTIRKARGHGYPAATVGTLAFPDWNAAYSMLLLDSQRMADLRDKSIQNAAIDKLHATTIDSMKLAQASYKAGDYSNYLAHIRSALGTESRAYPDVRNTGNDTVIGVVFYLFLLLPFCFFVERLFIASRRIERQLGFFFVIFVGMFLLLSAAHPAFSLVTAPSMILLSFVMMALSILVVSIVYGKFNTEMKKIQAGVQEIKQEDGTTKTVSKQSQSAEINRSSALMLALTLGISNMKKRPIRTGLTCATVIILTFTTLSFTSVVNSVSNTGIELPHQAVYDGILLHDVRWKQLPTANVDFLQARYSRVSDGLTTRPQKKNPLTGELTDNLEWAIDGDPERALVLPRTWMMPIDPRTPYKLEIIRPADGETVLRPLSVAVDAGIGLAPAEGYVLTNGHSLLEGMMAPKPATDPETDRDGWKLFSAADANEIIIAKETAQQLGFADPSAAIGQIVLVEGRRMTVRNVMDPDSPYAFDKIKELDNSQLTPAILSKQNALVFTQTSDSDFTVAESGAAAQATSQYMRQNQVALVPFETSLGMGGTLRAISIRNIKRTKYLQSRAVNRGDDAKTVAGKTPVRLEAEDLLIVLEKNIWVGEGKVATLYSSSAKSSVTGLINIVIPLLISALIILNTMVGAVYERRREIAIFSALGLAPLHIGMLFLAESLVYATLGGMSGYLLGQGISKVILVSGIDLGFSLNYSSTITVFVTAIVMGCVLLSTLYPAYVAQKIAVPSEEKREGIQALTATSNWLELPFSFPLHIVPGVAMFLHDYFESHTEGSVGKFTAKEVTLETIRTPNGPGLCLFFLCWPAPYDLGVSQEIQFYMIPDETGVFTSEMVMHHISGEKGDWMRVNRPFIEEIRRMMLLWRTFTPEQRSEYALRGLAQWYDSYEGIGWEMPEALKTQRNRELGDLTGEGEDSDNGDLTVQPAGA